MTDKMSILFVCTGNICRSPMAEFVLKDLVAKRGISERFHIESAATTDWEVGNPVHFGTRDRLAQEGISCKGKKARQINSRDEKEFDIIIGMDEQNMSALRRRFGNENGKIYKMLEFAGKTRDVADPYYTGDFDATYDDIMDGCIGLLGWLADAGRI